MSFNQDGAISSHDDKHLKLVEVFIYLGSNISSTEVVVNIRIGKTLTGIDKLSTIWKTDLSEFLQGIVVSVLLYGLDYYKALGENARSELVNNSACYFEEILETTA